MKKIFLVLLAVCACAPVSEQSVKREQFQIDWNEICTSENPIPALNASEEGDPVFAACDGEIREIGETPHVNAPGDLPDNPKGLKYISIKCEKGNIEIDVWYVKPKKGLKENIPVKQGDIVGVVGRHRDGRGNYAVIIMYDNNRKLYVDPVQVLHKKKYEGCEKLGSARLN